MRFRLDSKSCLVGILLTSALLGSGLSACTAVEELAHDQRQSEVIYNQDDRRDVYAYPDPAWRDRAYGSAVALVDEANMVTVDGVVSFDVPTLQEWQNLCDDQDFLEQPTAAYCSGTLIDDDLVLTAGHCVTSLAECQYTRFVFNYTMADEQTLGTITEEDVFSCDELVVQELTSTIDYAIIRLDRPATPRFAPAPIRMAAEPLAAAEPLVVMGCPSKIPVKIDDGGWVRNNRSFQLDYFSANLDTFRGNSGSGVYSQSSGDLVGVLVRGAADYDCDATCCRVAVCPDDGCLGEDATYVFRAIDALCDPLVDGSTRICRGYVCGDGQCDEAESTANCAADCGSSCGDGACNGGEDLASCPGDCQVCGDGACTTPIENLIVCPDDCTSCGDDVCAGGETSVTCPADCQCGDGYCDPAEDEATCCSDCGCPSAHSCLDNACTLNDGDGDTCTEPLPLAVVLGQQVLTGDTGTATNSATGTCRLTSVAPERVYAFSTEIGVRLEATVSGFDTVMYLWSDCDDPGSELACNDDYMDPAVDRGSRIDISLNPGSYFLFVDGFSNLSGAYDLDVTFTAEGCLDDSHCDDGLVCDGVESCVGGSCQPGTAVVCADDGVPCTVEACDEVVGGCVSTPDDVLCDNGVFCDGAETCDALARCQTGVEPCGQLVCDEATHACGCDFDGVCDLGEDCVTCPDDCISGLAGACGNGICEPATGEDCMACPYDCNGRLSGRPSKQFCCGDSAGAGTVGCEDAACQSGGFSCSAAPPAASCCGDLVCEGAEDGWICEVDCGAPPFCGDAACDTGEDECSCASDCGPVPATETSCADGFDDDCDGGLDCADADCSADPSCSVSCGLQGEACSDDGDCCSGKCRGSACR